MADLLIRGMALPSGCLSCDFCNPFADEPYCRRLMKRCPNVTRLEECPLVELPDHGRLIDADAFAAKYVAALPDGLAALKYPKNIPAMTAVIQALLLDIAEADTIIPASKEGE